MGLGTQPRRGVDTLWKVQQTVAAKVLKEARCQGQGEPEPRKPCFRQSLQVGKAEPERRHPLSWGRQRFQRRACMPGWVLAARAGQYYRS